MGADPLRQPAILRHPVYLLRLPDPPLVAVLLYNADLCQARFQLAARGLARLHSEVRHGVLLQQAHV